MHPHKVLIVDDSAFMRRLISDLIREDPQFEVVGTARNGKEALDKMAVLKPDVVTLDVEMPEMNGLDALGEIMRASPVPVIMLSGRPDDTIHSLELGAVDFILKPSGPISLDLHVIKEELLSKLRTAVTSNISGLGGEQQARHQPADAGVPAAPAALSSEIPAAEVKRGRPSGKSPPGSGPEEFSHLVAIGSSTGGPRALQSVLTRLPADFPAPILIVQHMPPKFTLSLAQRLDSLSRIRVVEAADGEPVHPGTAYIAPGGMHMRLVRDQQYRVRLTMEEPRAGHRPSVDVLFESLLPFDSLQLHAVLLTGMGSDGAQGMLQLKRQASASTIAQSEESCVVYGMPRCAVELKCVDHILPVDEVAEKLIQLTAMKRTG